MDFGDPNGGPDSPFGEGGGSSKKPLPADLPTSLDDRRMVREPVAETEMYDGWQGPLNPGPMPSPDLAVQVHFPLRAFDD